MPSKLPRMKPHISIEDEQHVSGKAQVTPAMFLKLPDNLEARTSLRKHQEYMGLGPFFLPFHGQLPAQCW
jgi:hypothetical protein